MKCPICHKEFTDRPAISRKDNKTEICPECGTIEALSHSNITWDDVSKLMNRINKKINKKIKEKRICQ